MTGLERHRREPYWRRWLRWHEGELMLAFLAILIVGIVVMT